MKTFKISRWFIAFKESDVVHEVKLVGGMSIIDQMGVHNILTPDEAYREYTKNLKRYFTNSVNKVEKSTGVKFPPSKEKASIHE